MGCALAAAACGAEPRAAAQTPPAIDQVGTEIDATDADPAALTEFREPLGPYGQWVDDPVYGTIWVPRADVVGADFTPYVTAGHWALTSDNQWTWVSDYSWGAVPFHYGRWVVTAGGWGWIPGRVYAPAWVVWRTGYEGDAYVGWAPMPPAWYWRDGRAYHVGVRAPARFVFVPSRYAFQPVVRSYIVPPARAPVIFAHSQPYLAGSVGVRYRALAAARGPAPGYAPPRQAPAHFGGGPAHAHRH